MHEFIPGQRWISNNEPELGLGIILDVEYQQISVLYLACDEKRLYSRQNAPLTRVRFSPGDTIESADNNKLIVHKLLENDGLVTYIGTADSGLEIQLEEIDLNHHLQFNKPHERLFTGQTDPVDWFFLRYETWKNQQLLQQLPVKGLLAGRTSLIPHQLYITHEVANRHAPRVMLADEVGLGKTIEAGLILHHRLINNLCQRVLIIVPASLLHQWLVEMLRRFNLHFSIFDEERCLETHSDQPFYSEQLIISSQDFFSSHPHRRLQAIQTDWDMIIVDEAHHLQWNEQKPSIEYQFIEQLGNISPSLILLTATPEQMGKESHFARLRLLDPDRFYSFEKFLAEETTFEPLAKASRLLLENEFLGKTLQNTLKNLLKADDIEKLLLNINDLEKSKDNRKELLKILLDHHGTGRILFRNSRQTVKGFPQRELYGYPLEPTDAKKPAAAAHKTQDLLQHDPRLRWLMQKIQEFEERKFLLICAKAKTAQSLQQYLKKHSGILAAVFHEGMTIVERDRAAAYFADTESNARLLICSEIGSEGRNFQFVHHLILFDLPVNPDLLQQRIGRLDRIGQQHIIQIHIPYIVNTAQQALFLWYDRGLNAFRQNCPAAQQVFAAQKNELLDILNNFNQSKLNALIEKTILLTAEINTELHNGRDQLLELNSCRIDIAHDLIKQINDLENINMLWPYMEKLFDCYGVDIEFHSPHCYIITPGNHLRTAHFPELPEEGTTITVTRQIALAREDMQFLTWEHPMVTAAMDLVLSSDTGNAAISIVKHKQLTTGLLLLEILFIVECSAPLEIKVGRFLPSTPIRILIDQNHQNLTEQIEHKHLQETDHVIDKRKLLEFLNSQQPLINSLLKSAENQAEKILQTLVSDSIQTMQKALREEIQRLVSLQKANPAIKDEEIEKLKEITAATHLYLQETKLKLDAVRVIICS
jgi:ATP-dependent helicase HepA